MIGNIYTPETAHDAARLRSELGDGAWFLGGGTELNSLTPPPGRQEHLISLDRLGMRTIEKTPTEIVVGAGCTLQEMVEAEEIPAVVRQACLHVENRSVRNQATIGGHVAAGHRYASVLPILVALDARVDVMADDGSSSTDPVSEHVGRARRTLITALRIPALPSDLRAAVDQHCRSSIDLAMLTVAVACRREDAVILEPRIVVGGLSGAPQRLAEVEQRLDGGVLPPRDDLEELVSAAVQIDEGDPRASGAFRRYMAGVLVGRALMGVAS